MKLASERSDYKDAVRKLAAKVRRYVEHVWPQLDQRGGVLDLPPMNKKEKGTSRPAIPDRGLKVVEANRAASAYLGYYLQFFYCQSTNRSSDGVPFTHVLRQAREHPSEIANWLAAESDDDRKMKRAFFDVCEAVARGVLFLHPDIDPDSAFDVVVNPDDEQLKADEWQTAHNRDNNRKRSYDARDTYRKVYPKWVSFIEKHEDATLGALEVMFSDWYEREHPGTQMNPRKIQRMRAYVERGEVDLNERGQVA